MSSDSPSPLSIEEYRALRATIRERGTARWIVIALTFVAWARHRFGRPVVRRRARSVAGAAGRSGRGFRNRLRAARRRRAGRPLPAGPVRVPRRRPAPVGARGHGVEFGDRSPDRDRPAGQLALRRRGGPQPHAFPRDRAVASDRPPARLLVAARGRRRRDGRSSSGGSSAPGASPRFSAIATSSSSGVTRAGADRADPICWRQEFKHRVRRDT